MAITPGNKFLFTDFSTLLTTANGRTSTNFDLTHFYDVSPMGYDGSSNDWGYRQFTSISIVAPGAGYKIGDVVSMGYGDSFEVVMVDGSGRVYGLRILNAGNGAYSDPASATASPTGGSGTGLTLTGTFPQYGPTASYALSDFTLNAASLMALVPVSGGSGYTVGDTLSLWDLTSLVATVATVTSGAVTSVTFTPAAYTSPVPTDWAAMASTALTGAGHGATFAGQWLFPQRPTWLTELNRLRNAIWNLPEIGSGSRTFMDAGSLATYVSGPWPVGAPTANWTDTWFWFAGTSGSVTVGTGNISAGPPYNFGVTYYTSFASGTSTPAITGTEWTFYEWDIIIGGNQNVQVAGQFEVGFNYNTGGTWPPPSYAWLPDGVDPSTFVSLDSGTTMPGIASPTITVGSPLSGSGLSYGNIYLVWTVNESVAPGRYKIRIKFTNPGDDSPGVYHTRIAWGDSGDGVLNFVGTANVVYTNPVSAVGIHNSQPVSKINVSDAMWAAGPGMWFVMRDNTNYPGVGGQFPLGGQPSFGPEIIVGSAPTVSTSPAGLWTAMCQPVSNLNIPSAASMPWNLQRTKYATGGSAIVNPCLLSDLAPNVSNMAKVSNSYDNTKTVEGQLEPPGWIAGRYFTVGFTIMDSNGNFQTCSAAGVSGATAPTWATGGYTFDGAATWSCVKAIQPAVSITPAQHRIPDMPRFPVYWYSETIARLMPPTSTSGLTIWGAWNQWQPNSNGTSTPDPGWHKETSADTKGMAYGWWIYSVSINRCMNPVKVRGPVSAAEFGAGDTGSPGAGDAGQSGAGAGGPGTGPNAGPVEDTSEIACTIGCMRTIGGVNTFVAFQTFQTGATYQVLWPVFTSDALVYQCAERLDIQAVAIASGGSVSVGATISEPSLVAAFVSDTIALLNLIV